jgi:hypothetical protein
MVGVTVMSARSIRVVCADENQAENEKDSEREPCCFCHSITLSDYHRGQTLKLQQTFTIQRISNVFPVKKEY